MTTKKQAKKTASKPRAKAAIKAKAAPPAKPSKGKAIKATTKKTKSAAALSEQPPVTKTYMSLSQQKWFKNKLETMLQEIEAEAQKTAEDLKHQEKGLADEVDRAHSEFAFVVDLRENERIGNLQEKINHSLRLLETGIYGYCDDCGDPIGIDRMVARPVATKCIDCKQFQENQEHSAF